MDGWTRNTGRTSLLAGVVAGATLAIALTIAGSAAASSASVPANTAAPTVSGTAQAGSTLTASTGTWSATGTITYAYAWQRCNAQGAGCGDIRRATAATYMLTSQDVNHTIRVVVTAGDSDGANTAVSSLTSTVTAAPPLVKPGSPVNTGLPTISGNLQEGATLTASTGTWTGNAPITYTYAWQRCDTAGAHCGGIGGASHATYQVQKADAGKTLRVVVTAKNTVARTSATSAQTGVVAAPAPPSLNLSVSSTRAVYGTSVTLSGTISTKQGGQTVTIESQPYGAAGPSTLGTVTTAGDGSWSFKTKPTIQTRYDARWNGATSSGQTVGVEPLVTFHLITHKRFTTKVVAARSFAGKVVQFQRQSGGKWVTMKHVHLGSTSGAVFAATLPKGRSALRIAFSVNQAGAGYLGGTSRTIVYPLQLT